MKIAKEIAPLNQDALFYGGVEPVSRKTRRIHSVVDSNYDFAANGKTDESTIENWKILKLNVDYGAIRDGIMEIVDLNGFAALTDEEKLIASKFCAADDNTLITYYASTPSFGMLGDIPAAANRHFATFSIHLGKMRDVAEARLKHRKVVVALMTYLADRFQIDAFTDSIRNFMLDYESKFHKGTQYGDYRDGIMDYIESTGSYVGAGLLNYDFSPMVMGSYIQANAVDPNNPTAQEQQDAEDYCRNLLITTLKDTLIYGKL